MPQASKTQKSCAYILDLEYFSPTGGHPTYNEDGQRRWIVQMACLKLPLNTGLNALELFERIVWPPHHSIKVDAAFTHLTGITQERITTEGIAFGQALASLSHFCNEPGPIYSNGPDGNVIAENCGWQREFLSSNLTSDRFRSLRPMIYNHLSDLLGRSVTSKDFNSGKLWQALDLPRPMPTLDEHNALFDVLSIAATVLEIYHRSNGSFNLMPEWLGK